MDAESTGGGGEDGRAAKEDVRCSRMSLKRRDVFPYFARAVRVTEGQSHRVRFFALEEFAQVRHAHSGMDDHRPVVFPKRLSQHEQPERVLFRLGARQQHDAPKRGSDDHGL